MGRFAKKHPTDLTELVGNAIANGSTPARVYRDLQAGTFPGWTGAYDMPLETVRYYGKREKTERAVKTISPTVRASPVKAVDDLARLLLSAAERGLASARPGIDKDPKALKEWGDALKTIRQLVSEGAMVDKPSRGKPRPVSDPLSATLAAAARETVPNTPSSEGTDSNVGSANANQPTNTDLPPSAGLPQGSINGGLGGEM